MLLWKERKLFWQRILCRKEKTVLGFFNLDGQKHCFTILK